MIEKNYLHSISGVALYLDEGTRYTTYRNNVLSGAGAWVFTNSYGTAHNTNDNVIANNWFNSGGASTPDASLHNNQIYGNTQVSGTAWPSGAQDVICAAGVAVALRTNLNANAFAENGTCGQRGTTISSPLRTTGTTAASTYLAQSGGTFALSAAGADVWSGGSQRDDQYGAIYQQGSVGSDASVSARIDALNDVHAYAKTGVMIRNDISGAGSAPGYAIAALTPKNGVLFQWDSDGDGYLDSDAHTSVDTARTVWVRLTRSGSQVAGSYSYDGANWVRIGSAVTLPGASSTQDGGVFATSHDRYARAINVVSDVHFGAPAQTPTPTTTTPTTTSPIPSTSTSKATTTSKTKTKTTTKKSTTVRCRTNKRGKTICRTVSPKARDTAAPLSSGSST